LKNIFLLFCLLASFSAKAELCHPKHIKEHHKREAQTLLEEEYSYGRYAGHDGYNAIVIGCNDKTDRKKLFTQESLDKYLVLREQDNLNPKMVRGKVKYLSLIRLRYGYLLEKKAGDWIATLIVKFRYPKMVKKKFVDVSTELSKRLGITKCLNGSKIPKARYCRLKRDMIVNGKNILIHHMNFWRNSIQRYWKRPGFKVKVLVTNLGEIPKKLLKLYKRKKIIWKINFNINHKIRATYRSLIVKPYPLYTGLRSATIAHEAGHMLGLNDEYPEFKVRRKTWKFCKERGGAGYIMCSGSRAYGVYPYVITRRYLF